jgi:glutathione S-transferase
MKLVIANKAYSSWSLRPWIMMRVAGIPFEEILIPLYHPDTRERILAHSDSGKVPVLLDGDAVVWESLAIIEHLADACPDKTIWPADPTARAMARAISAEMHAGFMPLRMRCPMNMRRTPRAIALADDVRGNIDRIIGIWTTARTRFGQGGPFLFGAFCGADAMYAPVVNRLHVYGVEVPPVAAAYMAAIMALPAYREWQAAAIAEPWTHVPYDTVA